MDEDTKKAILIFAMVAIVIVALCYALANPCRNAEHTPLDQLSEQCRKALLNGQK